MKKRMARTLRVLGMVLALTLAASAALAQGTDELQGEELVDLFKMVDADLSEPNLDGCEYEYVSEDGKTSKYYISYLNEIDGLKRTENKREAGDLFSYNVDEYSFEGDYCYLYMNGELGYLIPLFSKDLTVSINGVEYLRTNMITACTQEQIDILLETVTFRLTDNSVRIIDIAANNKEERGLHWTRNHETVGIDRGYFIRND